MGGRPCFSELLMAKSREEFDLRRDLWARASMALARWRLSDGGAMVGGDRGTSS